MMRSSPRSARSFARRMLVGVIGLAALVSVAAVPSVQMTEARFTDVEQVSASFTALALKPATILRTPLCVRPPALGGNVFSIEWQWPTSAPYDTFTAANVRWKVGTAESVAVPTTGPDASGRYTSTFNTGLLTGVLGTLLGADLRVEMRTTLHNWTSGAASAMTYNAPLLVGAPTCTIANG